MGARRLFVAAIVGLGALAFAGAAQACSCAPVTGGEALHRSDAAIVARLVDVVPRDLEHASYLYQVERVYRGDIRSGTLISVRGARDAAACAPPRRLQRRYGLFLVRQDEAWAASACGVVTPKQLASAARRPQRKL